LEGVCAFTDDAKVNAMTNAAIFFFIILFYFARRLR
jgi:hypothetical protein